MSWTDDQLERLRAKASEARRQGAWFSSAEAVLISTLVWTVRSLTMSKGWSGVAEGPLPTIATVRTQGIKAVYVTCSGPRGCGSRRRFDLEVLQLPESTVFVEIPKRRRFRCTQCGGRDVTIMADWPSGLGGIKRDVS